MTAVATFNNSKFERTEKIAFVDNTCAIKYLITIRLVTSVHRPQTRSKVCIVVNKSIYYIVMCTTIIIKHRRLPDFGSSAALFIMTIL